MLLQDGRGHQLFWNGCQYDGLKWNTEHKTQDTIDMLKQEDAKQYANQCSRTVLVSECSRAVCPRHP